MIPIAYINMDARADRMQFMEAQAKEQVLTFDRFAAVAPDMVAQSLPERSSKDKRPLTAGERSCLASHVQLWRRAVATQRPLLILEDDAQLAPKLGRFLTEVEEWCGGLDVLRLETRQGSARFGSAVGTLSAGHELKRVLQRQEGAAAYIITPSGAKKAIESHLLGIVPVDELLFDFPYLRENVVLQTVPPFAIQLDVLEQPQGLGRSDLLEGRQTASRLEPQPKTRGRILSLLQMAMSFPLGDVIAGLKRTDLRFR